MCQQIFLQVQTGKFPKGQDVGVEWVAPLQHLGIVSFINITLDLYICVRTKGRQKPCEGMRTILTGAQQLLTPFSVLLEVLHKLKAVAPVTPGE